MGKPSNRNEEEDSYHTVEVIKEEHDDGLENPQTVVSENCNTLKRPSSELPQTDPPLRREQDGDGSVEEIPDETETADMDGLHREPTSYAEQEDYGDSKLLTTNPSEDAPNSTKVVTHVTESVMKQENKAEKESSIASCDGKKTSEKKTSKEMTPSSPRLSPTSTEKLRNSRLPETNLKSGQLNNSKKKEKIPAHIGKPWVTWLSALFKTSKLLGVLKIPIWLAMIAVAFLPHHATALPVNGHNTSEPGCGVAGSSRLDGVLDSLDVQAGLDRGSLDGSGRGYSRVCRDAFYDVCVEHVHLQNNFLQGLPDGIFDYTTCQITSVSLSANNLTEFPPALNNLTDVLHFNLSDNKIKSIPRGTITGLTSLSTLSLSGNDISQVPEDIFDLLKHSLISVNLKKTQVQHPLVPLPQTMVCTYDNPCNVTHVEDSVQIRQMKGNKVTYEITQNGDMTCEKVKQQLEADYEVSGGSIHCENNVLLGTITIVRKSQSDTTTTFGSTQLDPSTAYVTPIDNQSDLGTTDVSTQLDPNTAYVTPIDNQSDLGTTDVSTQNDPSTAYVTPIDNQSDLGTTNVATTGNGQNTGSADTLSTGVIIIVLILVFVVGVGLGAGGMMCYKQHSSKTGRIAAQPPIVNHNDLPLEQLLGTSSSSTSQNTVGESNC